MSPIMVPNQPSYHGYRERLDPELSSHKRFWRAPAVPLAAALIGLASFNANALSLGKVRVQSALGQGLVAEIDIADLSEEEAKSIKPGLASPSAFAGMGLEYNPALSGTQIAIQRRPNGNRYLKLVNSRPLNDPFVDIVVELSWASGRIVRTYTLLLDPPKPQETASAAPLSAPSAETPTVTSASSAAAATAKAAPTAPASSSPVSAVQTPSTGAAKPAQVAAPPAPPPATATALALAASDRNRVRVRSGDTAGKIARSVAPEGVSVEQMLVAMLNTNPGAFSGGNVNRLKADAELVVPEAALAKQTSPTEARSIVQLQYQDFQALRRGLASQVPAAPAPSSAAEVAGAVSKATPPGPPKAAPSDTLKLSKGDLQEKAEKASMDQIAQQRAKTEASERAQELAKNIEELNQLAKVASKEDAASPPAAPASAAAPAPSAAPTITAAVPAAAAPESTTDLLDSAVQNPAITGLVLALLGLLGGLGWYRRKQRLPAAAGAKGVRGKWDASSNTAFELGGGARVDTTDVGNSGINTTAYSGSQLEMANELDPVAEAEVYLAYGKDVPAEEILREGLQQDPTRVAIHIKLLGIFAKREDAQSFDLMAQEVSGLVPSSSPEWAQVQEMGRSLSPSNPLYFAAAAAAVDGVAISSEDTKDFSSTVFSLDAASLQALSPAPNAPEAASVAQAAQVASTKSSFDTTSITLEPPSGAPVASPTFDSASSTDRLDATLALAEQFLEIGEKEGARALLEEVIAGGSEALRQRAMRLLAKAR